MKMYIIVRFEFAALHRWPGAVDHESSFLQHPHRHVFHVEAKKQVFHENRDIEFIELKNRMGMFIKELYSLNGEMQTWSCEKYAMEFIKHFDLVSCRVMEDNENGAEVEA